MSSVSYPNTPSERLLQANWELSAAMERGGLRSIMETAGRIFSCPLILVDEHFRIIDSCPKDPEAIPELRCMVRNCCLNERVIWQVLKEHTSGDSDFYEPFYTREGICSGEPLILGEVVQKDTVRGHLMVCLGKRSCSPEDLRLASLVIRFISLQLSLSTSVRDLWGSSMSQRLQELLTSGTPEHVARAAAQAISAGIPGRYAMLVAPADHRAAQQAAASSMITELQQRYRKAIFLYHAHAFVVLMGEVRYSPTEPVLRPENNRVCRELFEFFEAQGLRPGLSTSFRNLLQLRDHYHQALVSARLARDIRFPERSVFLDLMPYPVFGTLLKARLGYAFIHPVIFQIRDHDRQFGTEYEKTLCTYLLQLKDKDRAAAALHIHKNTLQYRLTRIQELFSVPMENTQAMLNLLCSAQLLSLDPSLGDRPGAAWDKQK